MTIILLVPLTFWGIDWAQLGGSHLGLSRDFSEMVAGAGILSRFPLSSLADDAGYQLGSQLGPQAATPAPNPAFLAARWLGSETEMPERTRQELHQLS